MRSEALVSLRTRIAFAIADSDIPGNLLAWSAQGNFERVAPLVESFPNLLFVPLLGGQNLPALLADKPDSRPVMIALRPPGPVLNQSRLPLGVVDGVVDAGMNTDQLELAIRLACHARMLKVDQALCLDRPAQALKYDLARRSPGLEQLPASEVKAQLDQSLLMLGLFDLQLGTQVQGDLWPVQAQSAALLKRAVRALLMQLLPCPVCGKNYRISVELLTNEAGRSLQVAVHNEGMLQPVCLQTLDNLLNTEQPDFILGDLGQLFHALAMRGLQTSLACNPQQGVVLTIGLATHVHGEDLRSAPHHSLDVTLALQRIGGEMGRLGGWCIELQPTLHVYWSDEIYRILQVPPGLGVNPSVAEGLNLYIPEHRHLVEQAVNTCISEGHPFDIEVQLKTYANNRIWVRVAGEAVKNALGKVEKVQGCLQDITEQRKALGTVNRINGLLHAQNCVNVRIGEYRNSREMFEEVCRQVPTVGMIPLVWIVRFDVNRQNLQVVAKGGVHQDLIADVMAGVEFSIEHPVYKVMENRQLYICNNIKLDPLTEPWRAKAAEYGFESFAVIPLYVGKKLYACMVYFGQEVNYFDESVAELLLTISKNRSLALENLLIGLEKSQTFERLLLLENCIERLNDIVLVTEAQGPTAEGPRILYANKAFYRHTGYTPAEVMGQSPRMLQGPDTSPAARQRIAQSLKAWQPVREELVNYTKDGRPYWIELDIVPIVDEAGVYTHWVSIQRDVTERKLAEHEKERNLERFRSLANATADCIWDWEIGIQNYIWWSDGLNKLFGYSETESSGSPEWRIGRVHPEDRERVVASLEAMLRGGKNNNWQEIYRFARADGTWADVVDRGYIIRDRAGRAVRMIGGMADISSVRRVQRDAETRLRKMHLLNEITRAIGQGLDIDSIYRVVANSLEVDLPSDFAFLGAFDAEKGVVCVRAFSNGSRSMGAQLGVDELGEITIAGTHLQDACTGQFIFQPDLNNSPCPIARRIQDLFELRTLVIVPLSKGERVLGVMVTARRDGQEYSPEELEFLKQLGEHVSLALSQAELLDELQRAYKDLTQTQEIVLRQERLRALAEMAGGIAHDINNAISPASLYVESLISRQQNLDERDRKQLRIVQLAIEDVANTVDRMSRFAKGHEESGQKSLADANEICLESIELTRAKWETHAAKSGISISIETLLHPGLALIQVSKSELREALTNVLINAVDSMPQGGLIQVITSEDTIDRQKMVRIEVHDTGTGMDEETRARCLEPFFTTKGDRGTGLGLSMVYGILKRLGGDLSIQSKVGAGTTVSFLIPTNQSLDTKLVNIPEIDDFDTDKPSKILLVDDDQFVLDAIQTMLGDAGHRIEAHLYSEQALAAFEGALASPKPFDLVITDLGMPKMNGSELAKRIKALAPQVPVLMLSGWGGQINATREAIEGVDLVVSKPPRKSTLLGALRQIKNEQKGGASVQ